MPIPTARRWAELPAYPIARVHTGQFYQTGPDRYVQLWESAVVRPVP